MGQGRPKNRRAAGSGEKLYAALKLCGLSFGARPTPGHISVNSRWAECGLPRSVNTVGEDIRSGIPVGRIGAYAAFFQVPPDLFLDETVTAFCRDFSCAVLRNKYLFPSRQSSIPLVQDPYFNKRHAEFNEARYLHDLYALLSGVYILYLREPKMNDIHKLAVLVNRIIDNHIEASGTMFFGDVRIVIQGTLFRWHTFLHVQYHSEDYQILGYMMTPDPLSSVLIKAREPLRLYLHGLAGSLTASSMPDRFHGYAEKLPPAESDTARQRYEALCERLRARPNMGPDDPDYAAVSRRVAEGGP